MSDFKQHLGFDYHHAHVGMTNVVTPQEHATAQAIIRDLMMFSNALQTEMYKLRGDAARGIDIDHALYEKMFQVQNKYDYAMTGFKAFDDETERRALKALSESIEDLMLYMNNGRH